MNMPGTGLHSSRWNRQGLLVKNRTVRILSTGMLSQGAGRRRLFLYTLPPAAKINLSSGCTDSTGPTATPAIDLNLFSSEVVGIRSAASRKSQGSQG